MGGEAGSKNLEGLGGWLILVGISVVLSPFETLIVVSVILTQFSKTDIWTHLPISKILVSHPFFSLFILAVLLTILAFFIVSVYLIYLFFRKKKLFPKVFIITSVSLLLYLVVAILLSKVLITTQKPSHDYFTTLVQAGLDSIIWVLYMLKSKRVKATFIR